MLLAGFKLVAGSLFWFVGFITKKRKKRKKKKKRILMKY
jgi:hypothetical protein